MLAKDIMTTNVLTVKPETTLIEVSEILRSKRVSGLPVVNDDNEVVGIITITDLMKVLDRIYKWKDLEKRDSDLKISGRFEEEKKNSKVKDFMTTDVLTLTEDSTIDFVRQKMFTNKIHTLPVVKDGKLIGIIGKHDLVIACF
ncbi:MAG: CBS domain-containing protein [Candidatus Omnitrophica bacterium]|nr:CBS domain-containing protein [Candidatus Omnitrophota bacterium]